MKHVLSWLAGWLAFFWLWQLLSGEWNHVEWIAGASAATLASPSTRHSPGGQFMAVEGSAPSTTSQEP